MATRRLTDAFLLMRNNAIQNRQILAEQVSTYDPRLSTRSNAAVSAGLHCLTFYYYVCVLEFYLSSVSQTFPIRNV